MTEASQDHRDDIVARAAVEAVLVARWECSDLLSRRDPRLAADLLRGHAAELTASPFARDQVLSLALEAAARDIDRGAAPLHQGAMFFFEGEACGARPRDAIRETILRQASPACGPGDVVAEFERRVAPEHLTVRELSLRMDAEAQLQESLWDDPRLAAQPSVRRAILCSVPRLAARAADLDPSRRRAIRKSKAGRRAIPRPPASRGRPARWRGLAPGVATWPLVLGLVAAAVAVTVLPLAAALTD